MHETVTVIFNLIDENRDGSISFKEYSNFLEAHEVETDYEANFRRIVTNEEGVITLEDAKRLLREFFLSNDPKVPGNYIFGPPF